MRYSLTEGLIEKTQTKITKITTALAITVVGLSAAGAVALTHKVFAGSSPPATDSPTVTDPSSTKSVIDPTYTIKGTVSDSSGQTVRVYEDANDDGAIDLPGTDVGHTTLSSSASTFSIPVTLSLGANNFLVTAQKTSGTSTHAESAPTDVPTITYNALPPAAPTNLTFVQGTKTLACGAVTNASGIYSTHLKWTIPAGETETYWRIVPTYPSRSHGTSYTWTSGTDAWIGANIGQGYGAAPNDQGLYSYSLQYKNAQGVWSAPAICSLTFDSVRPTITFVNPADFNNSTYDQFFQVGPNLQIAVSDPGGSGVDSNNAVLHVYNADDNSQTSAWCNHATSCDTSGLPDGHYYVKAGINDNAGNNQTITKYFTIDSVAPSTPSITAPVNEQWFRDIPITDAWTAASDTNGIDHYQIAYNYDNGHTFGGSTCPGLTIAGFSGFIGCRDVTDTSRGHVPSLDEEGGVTIWVRAIDTAGNVGQWSTRVHYYYDHTNPTINITYPTDGQYVNTKQYGSVLSVTGEFADNLRANYADMYLIKDGVLIKTDVVYGSHLAGSTLGTFDANALHLADGLYELKTVATDLAGNTAANDFSFYLDNAKPTARFTSDTSNPTPDGFYNSNFSVGYEVKDNFKLKSVDVSLFDTDSSHSNHWAAGCYSNNAETTADATGICTIHLPSSLPDGIYYVAIQGKDAAGLYTVAATRHITIDRTVPDEPTANPPAGNYTGTQQVTLTSSDSLSGIDSIYYTTDGSTPDNSSTTYSGPIAISVDTTIKAIAYDRAGNASPVLTAAYGVAPVINGEQAITPTTSTVTIVWTTSEPATSRVIYDTVSHSTLGSAPNYGYAFSTAEDSNKILSHSVVVTGLTPNTPYYFRGVSHGSPETVSGQISAATLTPPASLTDQGSNSATTLVLGANTGDQNNNGDQNKVLGAETTNNPAPANFASDSQANQTLKNSSGFLGLGWWWLAILATILAVFYLLVGGHRSDSEDQEA
jgi:hypothetical protein